jgi:hypothetical protein
LPHSFSIPFPKYNLKFRIVEQRREVWDVIRKKYVVLTPEEWVRQLLIHYLVEEKGYTASLLAVEKGINLNGTQKRCDIVAYNTTGAPQLIVECKAPEVLLTDAAMEQAARYNLVLRVPYLLVGNGNDFYCVALDLAKSTYRFLPSIPEFNQL